jgi:hypothetical protein
VIDNDPRFQLLLEIAVDYLESGVGGPFEFDERSLMRRCERGVTMGRTVDEMKAAVQWLEHSFLIMAIGPSTFKLSPDGIDYIKDPKSRDLRLPRIPPKFDELLLRRVAERIAFTKQLADEFAAEDAASGRAVDLPVRDSHDPK